MSAAGGPAAAPRAADRIRAAARDLFYRLGIRAVGVEEIVHRAGVTKPSLYRSFASKDDLAAAYLSDYDCEFWSRFEAAAARHPGDARAQILDYLTGLAGRAQRPDYRGCGLTNAALELPGEPDHPGRAVVAGNKQRLRARLQAMAREMAAEAPDELADALLLLIEGTFVTGQIFDAGGPAAALPGIARRLIEAHTRRPAADIAVPATPETETETAGTGAN